MATTRRATDTPGPNPAAPDEIREALGRAGHRLDRFLTHFSWYDEIGSTNDVAAALAEHDAPEGSVVAADAQTIGRGRFGRTWASPRGAGLYVSVVLRPPEPAVGLLTIAAGVAVAEGIGRATGLTPDLKWPNDVLISNRKVAGILAEGGITAGAMQHVVLGIGINVRPAGYPADIAARATSLEAELGRPVDRGLVLAEVLVALAARYHQLVEAGGRAVLEAWRERARATLGRRVEWQDRGTSQTGVAGDIDDTGALLVDTPTGRKRVIGGMVTWT